MRDCKLAKTLGNQQKMPTWSQHDISRDIKCEYDSSLPISVRHTK